MLNKLFTLTRINLLLLLAVSVFIYGCYSFSGASISPEIKTVNIAFFANRAPIVQSTLSQTFTEKLKDKFVSQTNLRLTDQEADISFEGLLFRLEGEFIP